MTKAQEWICRYLDTQFTGVKYEIRGDAYVAVIDSKGAEMLFTMNIYADIMDANTKQIIAVSDCPHTIDTLTDSDEPTRWENQASYFG